jgi:dsRNA-specific ribonuclease
MNMERVIRVVSGMLDVSVYFDTETPPIQSFKNSLQEWCADKKHRLPAPVYKTVSQSGPDHRRIYERAVIIGDRTVAVGKGKNLKIADAAAAEAALEILRGEESRESVKNENSLAKLKELAQKNKQLSPEFRDLGETPDSNEKQREYIIECRCMGVSCSGVGKSKQEAREIAAAKALAALTPKKEPKQATGKRIKVKGAPTPRKAEGEGKAPKKTAPNARRARKGTAATSPKKQPYQHKKHL